MIGHPHLSVGLKTERVKREINIAVVHEGLGKHGKALSIGLVSFKGCC